MSTEHKTPFGRADEDGNVYVLRKGEDVYVGQYPGASPEEAYAYFARKFADIEAQVTLLEQRVNRGAPASAVAGAVKHLAASLEESTGVGDYAALESRLAELQGKVAALQEKQHEAAQEAIAQAVSEREEIVKRIESLAAQEPGTLQWKSVTPAIAQLFDEWKAHQQSSPRIPKSTADQLWSRFRTARSHLEAERRKFFARLDEQHRAAKEQKQALIARAQKLDPDDREAISQYRRLLDEWKAAGRVGGKADDALWAQFKAAGDALYAVKKEQVARENVEYDANLRAKQELLTEAEALLPVDDVDAARKSLTSIQERWDAIGRVPRDAVRSIEDRLRRVERTVKSAENAKWKAEDPEAKERTNSIVSQLRESLEQMHSDLAVAQQAGDARKVRELTEAIETRTQWLRAVDH